jgi:acyl-CoA thioesterase-1
MKKNRAKLEIILVIGLLGYCVIGLLGCIEKKIKNVDSRGKNIICFGDSITFGYGTSPDQAYPAVLTKLVSFPVINAGIDGDTTIEAMRRLGPDVLDRNPLLVVIEFGGNDFLRKVPREVTIDNIKKMVQMCQAKGAMVALVDISAGMLLNDYRPAFLGIAREEQAILVPRILSGIITTPSLKSDFIHPNHEGYKVIALRVYRSVMPYLNKNMQMRRLSQ